MENNLKVQGFFLIDVDVVALNNAGKNVMSHFDNGVATKSIIKNGRTYTYVSGQAFRYWWREALQKNYGWRLSPIVRENKIAYTNANPIEYPDDDIFGYMRAASEEETDEKGKIKKKEHYGNESVSFEKFGSRFGMCRKTGRKLVEYGSAGR